MPMTEARSADFLARFVGYQMQSLYPTFESGWSLEHAIAVVGVPAYNEAKYLRAALESLRRQSMTNFLAVIADNA